MRLSLGRGGAEKPSRQYLPLPAKLSVDANPKANKARYKVPVEVEEAGAEEDETFGISR